MRKEVIRSFDRTLGLLRDVQAQYKNGNYYTCRELLDPALRRCQYDLLDAIDEDILNQKHHSGSSRMELLTEGQRHRLLRLNETLRKLEKTIDKETRSMIARCEERIASGDEFLKDYEIEIFIDCYGAGEGDTLIARLEENPKRTHFNDGTINYNDRDLDVPAELRPFHCRLFHQLYDEAIPHLEWEDLLDISTIRIGITLVHQSVLRMRDGGTP